MLELRFIDQRQEKRQRRDPNKVVVIVVRKTSGQQDTGQNAGSVAGPGTPEEALDRGSPRGRAGRRWCGFSVLDYCLMNGLNPSSASLVRAWSARPLVL
jgi:hypothetical protein